MTYAQGLIELDKHRLYQAVKISNFGTCPKRKVGCILVDRKFTILAHGYNHSVNGTNCRLFPCPGADDPAGSNTCRAVHAENHALINCLEPDRIHTCYITLSPCYHCIKSLLATSCKRIVFLEEYDDPIPKERWLEVKREWQHMEI